MPKPFIVAEISKNWFDGIDPDGQPVAREGALLLSEQFEQVIDFNLSRGYVLHTFSLHRLMTSLNGMNETIIAVFRRKDLAQ